MSLYENLGFSYIHRISFNWFMFSLSLTVTSFLSLIAYFVLSDGWLLYYPIVCFSLVMITYYFEIKQAKKRFFGGSE